MNEIGDALPKFEFLDVGDLSDDFVKSLKEKAPDILVENQIRPHGTPIVVQELSKGYFAAHGVDLEGAVRASIDAAVLPSDQRKAMQMGPTVVIHGTCSDGRQAALVMARR